MTDIDRSWSGFYKISGISQILAAILLMLGLFLFKGALSGTYVDRLEIFANNNFQFQLGNTIIIISNIFGILGVLGIFLSLYKLKKNVVLLGAALGVLGLVLGIGLRFIVQGEIALAVNCVKATIENIPSNYVAVENVIQGLYDIGLRIANLLLGLHGLIFGFAMLSGVFSKKVAYLFIITSLLYIIGFIGSVFLQVFGVIVLLSFILTIISMILIGIRLYSIGTT